MVANHPAVVQLRLPQPVAVAVQRLLPRQVQGPVQGRLSRAPSRAAVWVGRQPQKQGLQRAPNLLSHLGLLQVWVLGLLLLLPPPPLRLLVGL
jgi:hypothetical protein